MLPAQWGDMPDEIRVSGNANFGKCGLKIARVPENDRGDEKVEAGGTIDLIFEGSVTDLAQAIEEERAGERITGLALVQAGLSTPPQVDILQPVEREQGSFDPADLAQRNCQAVLTRVGCKLAKNGRGGNSS